MEELTWQVFANTSSQPEVFPFALGVLIIRWASEARIPAQQAWGRGQPSVPVSLPLQFSFLSLLRSPLPSSLSLSTFLISAPTLCHWVLDPHLALCLSSDLPGKLFQPTDSVSQITDSTSGPTRLFAPRPDGEPGGGPLLIWAWPMVVARGVRDHSGWDGADRSPPASQPRAQMPG